jgi:hypothetical protein
LKARRSDSVLNFSPSLFQWLYVRFSEANVLQFGDREAELFENVVRPGRLGSRQEEKGSSDSLSPTLFK